MAAAQGKKFRSGLDNGEGTKPTAGKPAASETGNQTEMPRIRPGEDMRSFANRVNAALPVSGLTRKTVIKDGRDEQGIKVQRTRKEKKMHKLYDQWRAEERKIQERREEELEEEAARELENDAAGVSTTDYMRYMDEGTGKKKKKGRKRDIDEDPWLELKRKRAEAKVGLHDVALAPPELNKKKTRQLKEVGGAALDVDSVPRAAGSLRRREELQEARNDVVEAYRKIREHEQAKLNAQR